MEYCFYIQLFGCLMTTPSHESIDYEPVRDAARLQRFFGPLPPHEPRQLSLDGRR